MRTKGSTDIDAKLTKVLNYCSDYSENNGFPPSVREIGAYMGVNSTATIHYYLTKLQIQGLIRKSPSKNRSLEIVKNNRPGAKYIPTPLVGNVSAGLPTFAEENIEEVLSLPIGLFKGDDLFALKVKGDSMIKAGIFNGDIIIVRKQNFAANKEIVVALVDNEATVKRLIKQNDKIILHPENDLLDDMIFDNVLIIGVVVGSIRNF